MVLLTPEETKQEWKNYCTKTDPETRPQWDIYIAKAQLRKVVEEARKAGVFEIIGDKGEGMLIDQFAARQFFKLLRKEAL